MTDVKTLLIDNYDSYTYNLYQLIARVNGGKTFTIMILTVLYFLGLTI